MKKVVSFLAVAAVVVMMSSAVFADDVNLTKSAFATIKTEELTFDADLYHWTSGKDFDTGYTVTESTTAIGFDVSGVTPGSADTVWAGSVDFVKIHSNLNAQQAGVVIRMYSDNANATGDYKANAGREEGSNTLYSGLVRKGNTSTYQDDDFAPLDMICIRVSSANASYKTSLPSEFKNYTFSQGHRYLLDLSDSNFATQKAANECHTVIAKSGSTGGNWVGCNDGDDWKNWYNSEDVIIFLGAQFTKVTSGSQYGTTAIKFVQEVE